MHLGDVMNQVEEVNGVKLLATSVAGVDMNGLRDSGRPAQREAWRRCDRIASDYDGKVSLLQWQLRKQ